MNATSKSVAARFPGRRPTAKDQAAPGKTTRRPGRRGVLLFLLLFAPGFVHPAAGSDDYGQRRTAIQGRAGAARRVPQIPPRDKKLRVIIDTDARNEIDDLWAIGLAVLSPERFQIEGFVAANYDNGAPDAGPGSIASSARAVATVLERAGLPAKFPVKRGSPPLRYQYEASESEGVDFIIQKAMASPPDDPLWVIGLGAATDIASAYIKEPRIAEHVLVFWHFRTEWPRRCWNFNVIGDVRAARLVFHSDLPFVLFDTGTHLTCPMEQSARWVGFSPLGRFLHEFRLENRAYQSAGKGFFDLGDIAALVDPSLATWEIVDCPEVDWDLSYQFKGTKGRILRCADINRDRTFDFLEEKLKPR